MSICNSLDRMWPTPTFQSESYASFPPFHLLVSNQNCSQVVWSVPSCKQYSYRERSRDWSRGGKNVTFLSSHRVLPTVRTPHFQLANQRHPSRCSASPVQLLLFLNVFFRLIDSLGNLACDNNVPKHHLTCRHVHDPYANDLTDRETWVEYTSSASYRLPE